MRRSLRRHLCSPAAAPLEDDNLLSEILLRLTPQPSSLPRASAVCRRWRLLISDPGFSRRFRRHHCRNPPLLGFYDRNLPDLSFVPTLEAPNRVPPGRLSLQRQGDRHCFSPLGCRHGLVLVRISSRQWWQHQVLVLDPITGEQHHLGDPPEFNMGKPFSGAVLRAVGDVDHFQVVLVGNGDKRALASVYSSETGVWSNLVTPFPPAACKSRLPTRYFCALSSIPAVLIGNSLYWLLSGGSVGILEFDLERHNLAVIGLPAHLDAGSGSDYRYSIMQADDGGLGFLYLSVFSAQLWKRKTEHDGVASWVLGRTIELDKLLQLPPKPEEGGPFIMVVGFAEDSNMVFLWTIIGIFTIHLESLQFKKLPGPSYDYASYYYPFESVYGAGV